MILVGDIASPNNYTCRLLGQFLAASKEIFENKRIVCNFEGLIYNGLKPSTKTPVLFNHPEVLIYLKNNQNPVLCLANNHILDLPIQFEQSLALFKEKDILYCGVGRSKTDAEAPVIFYEGSTKVALFNACWDFLLYNHKNPTSGIYVSELKERMLIKSISAYKSISPDSIVMVYLHWNLDLEVLPFPMYRRFSRDLINAGASLVTGSHSHCVQGGEKYKDGIILYGLGNFFIPNNQFINGKLIYPELSSIELALEWDPLTNNSICHWFKSQNQRENPSLIHLESEKFESSSLLKKYSPFAGMDDETYLDYFRKNRRKRLFIPVYKDYQERLLNSVFTALLKFRAQSARLMARMSMISWQN